MNSGDLAVNPESLPRNGSSDWKTTTAEIFAGAVWHQTRAEIAHQFAEIIRHSRHRHIDPNKARGLIRKWRCLQEIEKLRRRTCSEKTEKNLLHVRAYDAESKRYRTSVTPKVRLFITSQFGSEISKIRNQIVHGFGAGKSHILSQFIQDIQYEHLSIHGEWKIITDILD